MRTTALTVVMALTVCLVPIGCAGTPTPLPTAEGVATALPPVAAVSACAHAGPATVSDLTDALNLGADSQIPAAVYIRVAPINPDDPVQYAVAATVEGGSVAGITAVWLTTANLPADDPAGTWYSTDTATRDLSDYAMPSNVEQWALAAPEVKQARACLETG